MDKWECCRSCEYRGSTRCFGCSNGHLYKEAKRRQAWQIAEDEALADIQKVDPAAKLTPGSGNKMIKGDIRGDNYLIEVKTTKRKSYSISQQQIKKLIAAAAPNKRWILNIRIGNYNVALIEYDFLLELLGGE